MLFKGRARPIHGDLSPSQTQRMNELTEMFRQYGADNPERWANSEVREDIAQTARSAFIRGVWDRLETCRSERYIDDWATQHELNAEDRESLGRLVARAVYDASFRIISLMDSGENDSMPGFPGWWLVEVDTLTETSPAGKWPPFTRV